MKIKTVTVIGANGTMGSNVAGIFAAFGGAYVYMVSRSKEKSEKAIERAAKSVRADSIKAHMEAMDYSRLEECIEKSDLIFESVAEKIDLKIQVLEKIAKFATEAAWICSGTSGLSINKMSQSLPENMRKNYMGMHFFNPPYNMTLCEIVLSDYATEEQKEEVVSYVTETLLRCSILVKDKPAFMGNRIGFYLINLAMQYAEVYKADGGIDYIDAIMGGFTGRNMPPLRTADFVGLDIHKAIVKNVHCNTDGVGREAFMLPEYTEKLIEDGKVGRKAGEGLYKAVEKDGKKEYFVYDIEKDEYRNIRKYKFDFAEEMLLCLAEGSYEEAMSILVDNTSKEGEICKSFLVKYVLYSLYINNEVGHSVFDADDAMATGFSWIPPLALIEAFGGREKFQNLALNILSDKELREYDMEDLLSNCPQSRYDFRKYLKAKR